MEGDANEDDRATLLTLRSTCSATCVPAVAARKHISMQPNGGLRVGDESILRVTCQTPERAHVAPAEPWGRAGASLFCFDVRSLVCGFETVKVSGFVSLSAGGCLGSDARPARAAPPLSPGRPGF